MKLKEAKIKCKRGEVSTAVTSSDEAYKVIFSHLKAMKIIEAMHLKEHCYMFFLDKANQILGATLISVGSQDACVIDPKDVFRAALLACAHSIIIIHNHPTGNMKPSEADIRVTNKLKNAGDIVGVTLLDHIIVDSGKYNSYYSFADNGKI